MPSPKKKLFQDNIIVPRNVTKLHYANVVVSGMFACGDSSTVTSLEGAPRHIGGSLHCGNTELTSLHNIHKHIDLIGGELYLPITIASHVLGVMKIKELQRIIIVDNQAKQTPLEVIINKHLQGDRNIHDCQEELLEAGLTEFAKL